MANIKPNYRLVQWMFGLLLVLELAGLAYAVSSRGLGTLIYYTQGSNLFNAFVCAWGLFAYSRPQVSSLFTNIRFLANGALLMTAFVTVTVLIPTGGDWRDLLIERSGLFHHTLCPLLSVLSYVYLEEHTPQKRVLWLPIGVTISYGLVMLILNGLGLYSGPYFFFKVLSQPVLVTIFWMGVLASIIALMALLLFAWAQFVDCRRASAMVYTASQI